MKRVLSFLLVLLLAAIPLPAMAAHESVIRDVLETTGKYLETLGSPSTGSTGGEWMVLGLARSGRTVPDRYYDRAVAYVQENINENERLHPTKVTPNCRLIVALTAIGKDVTNVGGHNLLAGLNDMGYIQKMGVSGVIWSLIAFDCGGYQTPVGVDRETLLDFILSRQVNGGGWAVTGTTADPDLTSMAVTALAPYRENHANVATALDAAVTILSEMQDSTGNFPTEYGTSSESVSQVIVALSTLGIDANTDERFVKGTSSALDALLGYSVQGGGFRHILSGSLDGIATEQGYYALTAYYRMLEGDTPLFDMTESAAALPQTAPEKSTATSLLWLVWVLGGGLFLIVLCVLFHKKLGKRRFANALMVTAILLTAAVGIGFALQWGALSRGTELGSAFQRAEIPENRLVSSEFSESICTITIRCDTVLEHMDLLEETKMPYLPADGIILPEITVEFTPGESAFDVLQRVCQAAEIPLEYSWTPLYDSYYVEGISHLYEYDCGTESGWMYQINGTFPNYGCSSYEVQTGDKIQLCYTCLGLGSDLGSVETEG